jgi:hypothetical protein
MSVLPDGVVLAPSSTVMEYTPAEPGYRSMPAAFGSEE